MMSFLVVVVIQLVSFLVEIRWKTFKCRCDICCLLMWYFVMKRSVIYNEVCF